MTSFVFKLPDLGEGVVEAEIVAWHVEPGQEVRVDQPLVEVMTDKATVTIPSGLNGQVVSICGDIGETVAVGSELVCFNTAQVAATVGVENGTPTEQKPTVIECSGIDEPATVPLVGRSNGRTNGNGSDLPPLASPAVRRRARELEVELRDVPGSGPNGRITHSDIDSFLRAEFSPQGPRRMPFGSHTEEVHLGGFRRRIAQKMVVSSSEIPHFSYIEEVDITELEDLRVHLNENRTDGQPKLTYLPFIMMAAARTLGRFPQLNAHYDDKREVITRYEAVHLGIATQSERGLSVPVVQHAEALQLWEAAREMRRITDAARNNSISREELSGSTFTVTSLGRMGGIAATPIINHPEVAILGVNKAIDRPVVRHGQIAVRKIMHLSASFDHRVVDGADGATFVQCIKDYLEHPATIFI